MSLQDPLSDLFSRIRNAQMRNKSIVSSPVSKLRENILEVLKKEGYIRGYSKTKHSSGKEELDIELKYDESGPVISNITRIYCTIAMNTQNNSIDRTIFSKISKLLLINFS